MENKILFLDFDGVLFDTLREVYLVNRYQNLGVSIFDSVDEENYKLYYKYKYLVYNIWMFLYYNPLIFNNVDEIKNYIVQSIGQCSDEAEKLACYEIFHSLMEE